MTSTTSDTSLIVSRPSTLVVIEPTSGPLPPRLGELWAHRELFGFLVWRDLKVRYAQTALGAVWIVFQPLAMMLVYTFAFSHLAKVAIPGIPYPVFALAGLTLWIFVSRGFMIGSDSLIANMPLVTKTACPRVLIPLAAVVSVFVDFVVAFALYLAISAAYGFYPTWRYVFLPVILLVAFILTLGLSLLFSATSVRYRDVSQALPFLIQLWFFLSPIAYLLQTPGHSWETFLQAINPMVGLILALRWALLGTPQPHGIFVAAVLVSVAVFLFGVIRFAHADRTIADDV
jgi:lipopolysaccharide transport system permease protein